MVRNPEFERKHPRSPDGEFRNKTTDWAGQVSDRIGLPSLQDMLHSDSGTSYPDAAGQLNGRYGNFTVQNAHVYHLGGDFRMPDGSLPAFSPLGHVEIGGSIVADDGSSSDGGYFRFTATQTRDSKPTDPLHYSAHLDRMHVRGARGSGGGRELTNRLINWARQSGFHDVTVGPSEIGSYAWGSMGFDFADHESRRIAWEGAMTMTVQRVRDHFRYTSYAYGDDGSSLTDAQIKRMISQYRRATTIALAGGMSYQKLSQYGRKPGQGRNDWWAGKLGLIVGGVGSGRIKL